MKLYMMKQAAVTMLKANLTNLYSCYYTENSNKWMYEAYGEDPFIEIGEVDNFTLADLRSGLKPGEIDLENCKIIYSKLKFLSESQASDERLWAGLTHTVFYDYMRSRWGYNSRKSPKSSEKEVGEIKTRFYYNSSGRSGFYRNTLAKCWWVGHNTYSPEHNCFKNLDIIGSNDINSKINELFYNFTFSSNPNVRLGIIDALNIFKKENTNLSVKKHIRPAMSYLNAVGGTVVIDCLPKDEIRNIFYGAVESIINSGKPSFDFDYSIEDKYDVTDEYIDNENEAADIVLGCKIVIKNETEMKNFKYDLVSGKLPKNLKIFEGCKVGDFVELESKKWKIEKIYF